MAEADRVRVVGVDPGKTTGLALLHGTVIMHAAVPFDQVETTVSGWLDSEVRTIVAVERFVITARTGTKTQQTDALKLSGVVQNLIGQHSRHTLVYQNMADAKRLGNPAMLRALGWWKTGRHATHMNDASSQVFQALAVHHPVWIHTYVTPDMI